MWIFYCGITNGQCRSLNNFLLKFSKNHVSSDRDRLGNNYLSELVSYNAHDIAALQLLFPCLKLQSVDCKKSTYRPLNPATPPDVPIISQDILKDLSMVLYLFQCFQEAQDDKMCEILSASFDDNVIKLCRIRLLPYQIASLGFFLSQSNRNWELLDLSRCHIGDNGVNILHHYLLGHRITIRLANFFGNNFNEMSSPLLGDLINHLQLNELIMDCNAMNNDIITAVINSQTVKKLRLYGNMDYHLCTDHAQHLKVIKNSAKIFSMLLCLEKLHITGCILNDNETYMLSKELEKSSALKELNLETNSIGDLGAISIASSLMVNTSLVVLNLCDNKIHDEGMMAFAATLTANTSLEIINMAKNCIGERGITELGTALLSNNSLKELNILTTVKGGERGASAVAASLVHNTSLEVLHMTCDQKGATSIAKALTTNKTLKKLFLDSNSHFHWGNMSSLNEEVITEIIRSLHKNNTLSELGIPPTMRIAKNTRCSIDEELKNVNVSRSPDQKVILRSTRYY